MSEIIPAYQKAHRYFESLSILVYLSLFGFFLIQTSMSLGDAQWFLICLTCFGALLFCDLLSGIIHWAADTLGSFKTPVFGPWLIRSFREHHVDPQSITRHDFVETNGASAIGGLVVLLPIFFLGQEFVLVKLYLEILSLSVFLTNQIHKWAHTEKCGPVVLFLQRYKVILPPQVHCRHHSGRFDRSYCITLGLMNRVLDFFVV